MKQALLLLLVTALSGNSFGQANSPYTLKTQTDSFTYSEVNFVQKRRISYGDTSGFGTNYYNNVFRLKTESDSFSFRYNPQLKPKQQSKTIHLTSPRGTQVVYLTFHPARCWFSDEYLKTAQTKAQYEIPESFELANVLYTLTSSSANNDTRTLKGTAYYNKVLSYFSKYKNHPLLKILEFGDDAKGSEEYISFRDNSFCFSVNDGKLVANNQYFAVWGDYQDNLFSKHLDVINDFYKKTAFHQFYVSNTSHYAQLINTQEALMPAKKMWRWLEDNFDARYQSYRIVFSPLIKGSHGTQNFQWIADSLKLFKEAVMFLSGTRGVDADSSLTSGQKEGISSGILFTEIDHNYCNPVSYRYKKSIDSVMSNRASWVSKGGDEANYPSQLSVFNEYITHAVFLLYAFDVFNKEDFRKIRQERERIMIEQRKYVKFSSFADQLLQLYQKRRPEQKIQDLYPQIIAWCKSQN